MVFARLYGLVGRKRVTQFLTFCMVGALGVALNYSIFLVFLRVLKTHYLAASAAGFTLPIFVAFSLNKRFTFKIVEKKGTLAMLVKYTAVCLFSLFLDQLSMLVQVEILHVNSYLAKVFAMGVTTTSNFLGSKFLAFRSV